MLHGIPDGVPSETAEAARDNLATGHVHNQLRTALLDVAREGFTLGFDFGTAVSAAAVATLAIVASLLLPDVHPR